MTSSNVKSVKTIRYSNSTNLNESAHNSSSKSLSYDDEDEHFYDAPDAVDTDFLRLNGKTSFSDDVLHDELDEDDDDDVEIDDDEKSLVFFDTSTSRHASEISTNDQTLSNLGKKKKTKSTNTINEDDVKQEAKNDENTSKTTTSANNEIVTVKVEDNDDDDEADAELETAWSFWVDRCFRGASKQDYEAGIKRIHTVKTVQTFWSVFNHIPDVSRLPKSYSYHLMRNDRRPLWEDPENSKGGLWKLKCKKEDTSLVWYELLLAGIGEQLSDCVSPCDDIIGLSVGCRDKEDIIQIWNLDSRYESEARVIERVQELVPNVEFTAKFYKPHNSREVFEGTSSENNKNKSNNQSYQHFNANNNNNSNSNHSNISSNYTNSKIYKSSSHNNLKAFKNN